MNPSHTFCCWKTILALLKLHQVSTTLHTLLHWTDVTHSIFFLLSLGIFLLLKKFSSAFFAVAVTTTSTKTVFGVCPLNYLTSIICQSWSNSLLLSSAKNVLFTRYLGKREYRTSCISSFDLSSSKRRPSTRTSR